MGVAECPCANTGTRHASASARLGWCATVEKVVSYPRNARLWGYFHRCVMQLTLTCWRSPYCFDASDMPLGGPGRFAYHPPSYYGARHGE
jgi:hypothetical protein